MHTLLLDLRYAFRTLLRQPVFSVVALLTLALGIGANTAVFSLIHAVLLSPLPYPHAGRLVSVWSYEPQDGRKGSFPVSLPKYESVRDQQDVFEDMGVTTDDTFTLTGRGEPAQVQGAYVSARYLQTLGVAPLRGRLFLPAEDVPGGPRVVALSESFWQKHCAGDPGILGQTLTLNGDAYTVVGVVPAQTAFPLARDELFVPGVFNTPDYPPLVVQHGGAYLTLTGRLRPGVSVAHADEAVRLIAARYRQTLPNQADARAELLATDMQEDVVADARPMFYTLAGAVGGVLLIACVNVANLLLARLAGRRKEIAVRAALGAGRWRLARQFLTESVLLTLLAGALGTLLALWGVDFARTLGPEVMPRAGEVRLSAVALGFTLAVSLGTGLLLGVVPALHAARGNPGEALQGADARGSAGGVRQGRTRAVLLVAQVAMSLVLLAGTGLLLSSLWQLQRVRLGYNPAGVLVADLTLPVPRYPRPEQRPEFFARLTERVAALPGVRRVMASSAGPFHGGLDMFYAVVGQPVPPVQERPHTRYSCVGPGYFATLETPLLQGRDFDARDAADAPPVMVINETMARRLFPHGNALGAKLLCTAANPTVTEIVGIVGDGRTTNLARPPRPEMYFSMWQRPETYMSLYVRAERPEGALALGPAVRTALRGLDADEPIGEMRTLDAMVSRSVADRHLMAVLLAVFAGLALVLAAIGVYGVTAYGVAQRTREIGIRLALGAQRADVFRLIVGGGMKLIAAGIVLGVVCALGLTRLLGSLLYGVGAGDPATFGAVVGLLVVVALAANYLPARRAARVDPLASLREE